MIILKKSNAPRWNGFTPFKVVSNGLIPFDTKYHLIFRHRHGTRQAETEYEYGHGETWLEMAEIGLKSRLASIDGIAAPYHIVDISNMVKIDSRHRPGL